MFVDTSVIVAILMREPEADHFARRLEKAVRAITSPLVVLEASMVLAARLDIDPVVVEERVQALLGEARVTVVPIDASAATRAVAAFSRYGKDRGHAAQLNLSDCMSYAVAQIHRTPLLYKGDDFARTDLA